MYAATLLISVQLALLWMLNKCADTAYLVVLHCA